MRIVLTWQPEDTDAPQTVYVEDATDAVVAAVEEAFRVRESDPEQVLTLSNVSLADGDGRREEFMFRVGRLVSYQVLR